MYNTSLWCGQRKSHASELEPSGEPTHLSEELLEQGGGPAVVEVPTFGRMADVSRVQEQGQRFGLIDAGQENKQTILNLTAGDFQQQVIKTCGCLRLCLFVCSIGKIKPKLQALIACAWSMIQFLPLAIGVNFVCLLTKYLTCYWTELDIQDGKQPTDTKQLKTDCSTDVFTNTELNFAVVVAENYPQHTL